MGSKWLTNKLLKLMHVNLRIGSWERKNLLKHSSRHGDIQSGKPSEQGYICPTQECIFIAVSVPKSVNPVNPVISSTLK